MLEILNLRKAFGSHVVLREVSLTLRPGSIHGLVGANGAGKTTLINCLYGLEKDFTGTVKTAAGRPVREHTGLLPYEPYFYPRLTGREYLEFCLQARGRPLTDFTGWNQLLELPLDQFAEEYSAGMRKKLALLALLVQNFDYLILDEPFNGLDLEANLLLKEILKRLRDRGTGILLTSHILGALTETSDEISVLVGGRIQRHYQAAEFGTLEKDLLDSLHREKLALLAGLV
ncbi:ATP-binding cassette domain-containing protein [Hymenobacter properus]|uniref:ATP-binding cassette domain-containing protein n=1 Tax=Hymenobacter properus TaxID=2791026 RepID=A0A931BK49_9BACT|nr:ATP-binding cassette domain-containing protein [Hymenobacter properus]MBF9144036.1 ATP-binding cassette domain-containing protein [Hymenobacter properus]MBR7722853.1 ATP-binding cassette domain-containing protein [Microvirga sp. SRT04]